jgi:hypothetical protein
VGTPLPICSREGLPNVRLEAHADEIMNRALAIIRTGDDADAWRVIEGLMNRAYGRSKETVEHQTSELDRVLAMPREERDRLRDELAARRAQLAPRQLGTAS